jgi:hypothetical protein
MKVAHRWRLEDGRSQPHLGQCQTVFDASSLERRAQSGHGVGAALEQRSHVAHRIFVEQGAHVVDPIADEDAGPWAGAGVVGEEPHAPQVSQVS